MLFTNHLPYTYEASFSESHLTNLHKFKYRNDKQIFRCWRRLWFATHTVTALRSRTLIIVPPGCTIFVRVASITLTALDGHRATTERTLCASGASLSQLLPSQWSRIARESEWYINDQRSALFNFSFYARLSEYAQPFVRLCQRHFQMKQPAVWHQAIGR
jgi:hypothetical protein